MDGLQEKGDVLVGGPEFLRKIPRPIVMGGGQPVDRVVEALLPILKGEHHTTGDMWPMGNFEWGVSTAMPELRGRRDAGIAGTIRPE